MSLLDSLAASEDYLGVKRRSLGALRGALCDVEAPLYQFKKWLTGAGWPMPSHSFLISGFLQIAEQISIGIYEALR